MTHPEGGMFVWVGLPDQLDSDLLLDHAVECGVTFLPGSGFYAEDPVRSNLRLSFCTYPVGTIEEGVRRLAAAVERAAG
jgi:2-aminoadipate transaminase